ncbi:Fc.00g109880.m01.CDS01 [Cosmosporella sp. VM-42]
MLPRWTRLWTLLCVILVIQLVSAGVVKRQDGNDQTSKTIATRTESDSESKSSPTKKDGAATKTSESSDQETGASESATRSLAVVTTTGTRGTTKATAQSTVITSDGTLDNSTFVNATIPHGQLPIPPEITPGWGVAGVILLLTGIAHTLIGIKNRAIHTFFSTAYVAALGVTVLIVYVMDVPISNALQGGYVVAAVVSGCVLGAASLFFRELTEGLGCALGGFCVAMWLLCLVPGGLLHPVASKAIFIACFTLGGFAFYFSHYTRDWALIVMIAFSGATITVLGIDCFSRAGLKEFWAYVWDLNDELFPLGATTYPVTKGIRVETAAVIIIFLFGIVSQIKLWKIVREQREKRAEELAEGQRNLHEEEENAGRHIEEATRRDRRQWERVYGEGDAGSSTASRGSDTGDLPNEKQLRSSHTGSSSQHESSFEVIELNEMADHNQRKSTTPTLMLADDDKDGKVTVRVAADEAPPRSSMLSEGNEKVGVASSDGQTLVPGADDRRTSQMSSFSQPRGPEIVPLPFTIPIGDDNVETQSNAERSSVATFADDEEGLAPPTGHRHSVVRRLSRLSHGSTEMFKRMSRGSLRGEDLEGNESAEDLVIPRSRPHGSDDGSIAATIDDESISAGDRRSMPSGDVSKRIEITAELSDKGMLSPNLNDVAIGQEADVKSTANLSRTDHLEEYSKESLGKAKSEKSGVSSTVSLTKDRLPRSLSRVALSYRTNEWAKHLSQADAPDPDELRIEEPPPQAPVVEKTAPVFAEELQKTASQGTPPPAITRSDSQASNMSYSVSRRNSRQNVPANLAIHGNVGPEINRSPNGTPPSGGLPRSSSAALRRTSGGAFEPIAEERPTSFVTAPIAEEGTDSRPQSTSPGPGFEQPKRSSTPGIVSYASPQTLIGQREMFLRNKSQGNLLATSSSDLNLNRFSSGTSDAGSLHNYPVYAAAIGADADEIPLSQRKQLMRQSSLNNAAAISTLSLAPRVPSCGIDGSSPEAPFDSHQPKRSSTLPTPVAREIALASFRQSVQHDLRAGTPVMATSGRETPFAPQSLLGGGREAEIQRNIDMGRNMLMGQKEAEAQRREMHQREKEWADRAFDERMRSGDLLEAHREAMRRMQKRAKD